MKILNKFLSIIIAAAILTASYGDVFAQTTRYSKKTQTKQLPKAAPRAKALPMRTARQIIPPNLKKI
ncbi:hypothetical protein AAIR98_000557 [Elusimicrobium simillimum]|uniref:hypothetical protein n=1 Tax=Elusimicrobium simillimum TaxID=3143438 RepID=UPI003C6F223A